MTGLTLNLDTLGDRQWLEFLVKVALEFKRRFGRTLPITEELGELYACEKLGLTRMPPRTRGYDAVDREEKKVQIKTRVPDSKIGIVNPSGRVGRFTNFDFDYALLVLLDCNYGLGEIWRADVESIRSEQKRIRNPRAGIHVSTFKKIGKKVWSLN